MIRIALVSLLTLAACGNPAPRVADVQANETAVDEVTEVPDESGGGASENLSANVAVDPD